MKVNRLFNVFSAHKSIGNSTDSSAVKQLEELDVEQLSQVSGGGPNGTWSAAQATGASNGTWAQASARGPNGTW